MLKVFDIHCRILLTTRNRSLADSVSGMYSVFFHSGHYIHAVIKTAVPKKIHTKVYVLHLCFYFVGAKYEVEVESGLDEKKGLEILALYTGTKPITLPEEARSIVRECKGL